MSQRHLPLLHIKFRPSPSIPISFCTRTSMAKPKTSRKFHRGSIMPSNRKRSEARLEIHHLRRLGAKLLLSVISRILLDKSNKHG